MKVKFFRKHFVKKIPLPYRITSANHKLSDRKLFNFNSPCIWGQNIEQLYAKLPSNHTDLACGAQIF